MIKKLSTNFQELNQVTCEKKNSLGFVFIGERDK